MPLNGDTLVCVNHPDQTLVPLTDASGGRYLALMRATRPPDQAGGWAAFDGDQGLLVVAHACPLCGYLELYTP
ncbi:MAG: hypothetical protein JWO31_3276 [Phycisphaerales bacterium]|nr:hypothetical protein [Phycisphaerales bacterium]